MSFAMPPLRTRDNPFSRLSASPMSRAVASRISLDSMLSFTSDPCTVTVSVTVLSGSVKFTSMFAPLVTATPRTYCGWNPASSTLMSYSPGGRLEPL